MSIGQHKERAALSLYDKLKVDWVSRFTEFTLEETKHTAKQHHENKGKSNRVEAGHCTSQKVEASDFLSQSRITLLLEMTLEKRQETNVTLRK